MRDHILVFYGSYRSDRKGIRLAEHLVRAFAGRGATAELIDAKALDLPMLDRCTRNIPRARRCARPRSAEPVERLGMSGRHIQVGVVIVADTIDA